MSLHETSELCQCTDVLKTRRSAARLSGLNSPKSEGRLEESVLIRPKVSVVDGSRFGGGGGSLLPKRSQAIISY